VNFLKRVRARVRPDIREAIDGFGVVFAVTLFFCLLNAALEGTVYRNKEFDKYRWWYPVYQLFHPQ
jgi:hypothetical protein